MRTSLLRLALLAPLVAGCTGGVELEVLPEESASVYCETITTCAGSFASIAVASPEGCEQSFAGLLRATLVPTADELLARGTVGYDAGNAAACLDATRGNGCVFFSAAPPPACREVLVGTLDLGASCVADEECAGDAYCDGDSCPETRGTCAARKANGATCESTGECQDGLVCEDGSCGPPSTRSGGACGGDTDTGCPIDEVCFGEADGVAGTCTPFRSLQTAALGEACQLEGEQIFCQEGLSCAVTGVDGIMPNFECVEPTSGGSCFVAVPEMCPSGQYCDARPRMLMFEGTCQPLPTRGQPCATVEAGPRCASGLSCAFTTMTCVQPQDNGASCEVSAECYSGRCEGGTCQAPPLCPAE